MDTSTVALEKRFGEGQITFAHRSMLLVEFDVVLPTFASCLLTRFRSRCPLGET
ncbi:MAG: hypothetical protein QM612_01625 [Thermomonas sp.]|uniref:hypothetical protein n=1 Tax=Thermomonas sp. TaxID=1971895 RepID=UPI0039E29348